MSGSSSLEKTRREVNRRSDIDKKVEAILQAESQAEYLYVVTRVPEVFAALYFDLELAPFQIQGLNHVRSHRRSVMLWPKGHGKALALDTPIPTPTGWTTIGDINVGDELFAADGSVCSVVAKSEVWKDRPCYRVVERKEKEHIIADEEHLWVASIDHHKDRPRGKGLYTTRELASPRSAPVRIPVCGPLSLPEKDLPIPPYALGVWLGDGTSSTADITVADSEILDHLVECGVQPVFKHNNCSKANTYRLFLSGIKKYSRESFSSRLKMLSLIKNKHIPTQYLRASVRQRQELLRGLIDTDGHVSKHDGQIEFTSTNPTLALNVLELIRSLGKKATMTVGYAKLGGQICGLRYRVSFYMKDAAYVQRKRSRCRDADSMISHTVYCEQVENTDTVCIQVDSPDGTFLAGWSMMPTHNSTLISKVLPVLEICSNPNVRIILIMKTAEDASAYSNIIRTELQENKRLVEDFGVFYNPDAWSANSFNVAQRQVKDPHYTLEIYGVGGKYLGHRCDIVICDDIVTEENSWTREQREKLKQRFETAIQTGPQAMWPLRNPSCKWEETSANLKVPQGVYWPKDINYDRVIVCGTRFHPQDLYNKLEKDPTYACLYFDCWQDKECTKPIWPAMWTKDKLEAEKKSLGTLSFNKRYRNIAIDESELGFRHAWIFGGEYEGEVFPGCLDTGRDFGEYPDNLTLLVGFDPASGSTSRYATFPSFVCLGYDPEEPIDRRRRYIIDIFRKQTGFDELIDVLLDGRPSKGIPGFRKLYHYQTAIIEKNGYGTMFIDNDRMRRAQAEGLRVVPHWTQSSRLDPVDGAFTMQGMVRNGLLRIPYGPKSQKKAEEFIDQWLTFPKGVVDYVMSTWFCELQVRKQASRAMVHRNTPGRFFQQQYWNRPSV